MSQNTVHKQQRLVLGGMGGIGKTQLAITYAKSYCEFYSSVLWLDAASDAKLNDSLRSVASIILSGQNPNILEGNELRRGVHQWLSDLQNTRWLLVFDNYDDADRFDINTYFPPISHGALIITTRRPDLIPGGPQSMHIEPLQDIQDGVTILQKRSKREDLPPGMLCTDLPNSVENKWAKLHW